MAGLYLLGFPVPDVPAYLDSSLDQDQVSLPDCPDFGFDCCRNQQLLVFEVNLKLPHHCLRS
jgi:hypothetical protein